ncbi:uncharacterized protein LOC116875970 [Lontra canadensis]|uniref:uncharacterized protein LOC116875970 n=1 Tax=Lontra canadensis TaxID=76717 RepID=UPI0013F2C149|nr:uncharacterized protein LOC116875970 [Lontra canadensis]
MMMILGFFPISPTISKTLSSSPHFRPSQPDPAAWGRRLRRRGGAAPYARPRRSRGRAQWRKWRHREILFRSEALGGLRSGTAAEAGRAWAVADMEQLSPALPGFHTPLRLQLSRIPPAPLLSALICVSRFTEDVCMCPADGCWGIPLPAACHISSLTASFQSWARLSFSVLQMSRAWQPQECAIGGWPGAAASAENSPLLSTGACTEAEG